MDRLGVGRHALTPLDRLAFVGDQVHCEAGEGPGHARQAGHVAAMCHAGAYLGRKGDGRYLRRDLTQYLS